MQYWPVASRELLERHTMTNRAMTNRAATNRAATDRTSARRPRIDWSGVPLIDYSIRDSFQRAGLQKLGVTTTAITHLVPSVEAYCQSVVTDFLGSEEPDNEHKDEWRDHRKRVQSVCPGIEQRTRALSRLDRYTSTQGDPLDTWFLGAFTCSRGGRRRRGLARKTSSNSIGSEQT